MSFISSLAKKAAAIRPLYAQIALTVLVFFAMISLSHYYMRDIVHTNLVRNAESMFAFAQMQLESDLQEPRMMVSGFSQTVRSMIMRGDSLDDIADYFNDLAGYFHSSGSRIMSSIVMFGYFETYGDSPIFIINSDTLPDNYSAPDRPWFHLAVEHCGTVIETPPYDSVLSVRKVISYARCIHGDNDVRLGIIGMEVNIEDIGRIIVDIAGDQGSYGMLISQDLSILAHANPEFLGSYVYDLSVPFSVFSDDFFAGRDIIERPMISWTGESTVAFFRMMNNGWYLGLLMPEGPFYQSLTNMTSAIVTMGLIFAAALIAILIRIDMARSKSDKESRHKSAFLANMSHEIRTPMNAIIGMTTIGKSSTDIERKDHCFLKIQDASNHLLGVINDILDMSKIEANKFDLSPSEFNFEKMLQRVVNVVNFRIEEKNQKFSVHIDQSIPKTLIGDDQRIAQVITNLLGNAIKFTHEKGFINLDAHCLDKTDEVCSVRISVSDNGIGMTAEQQSRAFSSFEQAESSTTRKYGGTGLGLAISKNIIELMGGRIWLTSELNKGSIFTFVINLKQGLQPYKGLLSSDVNLSNVRIMAVDDDRDILDYFLEISKEFNILCDTAISGEDAIKLVEKNGHYHIYFVDWKMPGMDGIQLASELKAHHESVKSVVIMITAAEWSVIETEARMAGVNKFLSKPLFPSHIADILNETLGIDHKQIEESQTDINGIFANRCILLVEDVEINREIVKALLEPTDINIDCAENGAEAVRIFRETPYKYDIIFMDVQMPVMDGYEATRRIRALKIPQAETIRIIAMTANVFREDVERCLEAGMNSHLGKPLDFDDVVGKLRYYLLNDNGGKER
ncbi:MAG: response regulator [Treponema sp.]|nr:response regulator [Treponema sp.]